MRTLAVLVLACVLTASAFGAGPPMTREQALDAGKALGASGNAAVSGAATGTNLGKVPGYQGTDLPETGDYGAGVGIEDAARQALPGNPVGTYVEQSAATRPQFRIDRSDPMVKSGDTISANPEAVVGNALAGTYSGCHTVSSTPPATGPEERCTAWNVSAEMSCTKALEVTVTQGKPCVPGQQLAIVSAGRGLHWLRLRCTSDKGKFEAHFEFTPWCYWDYHNTEYTAVLSTEREARILARGPIDIWSGARTTINRSKLIGADYFRRGCFLSFESGGCTETVCRYRFRFVDEYNWDDGWYPDLDTRLTLKPSPPDPVVVTDRWEDGCTTLEARTK